MSSDISRTADADAGTANHWSIPRTEPRFQNGIVNIKNTDHRSNKSNIGRFLKF